MRPDSTSSDAISPGRSQEEQQKLSIGNNQQETACDPRPNLTGYFDEALERRRHRHRIRRRNRKLTRGAFAIVILAVVITAILLIIKH